MTYTVTIARSVYQTVNVQVTADNEAAAIEAAKQLYRGEKTDLPWKSDVADRQFLIYEDSGCLRYHRPNCGTSWTSSTSRWRSWPAF